MTEQILTIVITAVCSVSLWQVLLQRVFQKQDKKIQREQETSVANISDRQVLTSELWKRIEKLEQAEEAFVKELINSSEQVFSLKARNELLESQLAEYRKREAKGV